MSSSSRPRYRFAAVAKALRDGWGFSLHRGGDRLYDNEHDGRWDPQYSRTGYIVTGQLQRRGYGSERFATLAAIVRVYDLASDLERARDPASVSA